MTRSTELVSIIGRKRTSCRGLGGWARFLGGGGAGFVGDDIFVITLPEGVVVRVLGRTVTLTIPGLEPPTGALYSLTLVYKKQPANQSTMLTWIWLKWNFKKKSGFCLFISSSLPLSINVQEYFLQFTFIKIILEILNFEVVKV